MPYRPIYQAETDLAEHFAPLGELMDLVHQEFLRQCRGIAHKLEASSRASIYRDLIVRSLREYCDATSGATFISKRQLKIVGLKNNWVLRVKRFRVGFSVAVSPTIASRQYDANTTPDSLVDLLPDNPPATCLYLGWTIAENAPGVIQKYLVCNDERRKFVWAIPLGGDGSPPGEAIEDTPLFPIGPADPPRRVRVKGVVTRKTNG